MNEMDGNPIIHSANTSASPSTITKNNMYNLPKFPKKSDSKLKFQSELSQDGYIQWKKLKPNRNTLPITFPSIQWNSIVQSLHHTEILQYQAWIVGKFKLDSKRTVEITFTGINTFWIDKNIGPIACDQYGNRPFSYSINLSKGSHIITSLVRAKHQTQLRFNIKTSKTVHFHTSKTKLIETQFASNFIPDIIDNRLSSRVFGVTIKNLSPTDGILLKSIENSDKNSISVSNQQPKWHEIYPNQISIISIYLDDEQVLKCNAIPQVTTKLTLIFEIIPQTKTQTEKTSETSEAQIVKKEEILNIRCRKQGQSFKMTFIDIDGSIQHAAVIHPLINSNSNSATEEKTAKYPILINLHGTGVSASDSADAYKFKPPGAGDSVDYTFGVENAWTIAPTRHGAHNWEGIGKNTAMTALNELVKFSNAKTEYPGDKERIIFAGHSMGGHGTFLLAVSNPDLAIGVIPQAGWYRKEYYGDSNTLFYFDTQNSFIDSKLKYVIESTIQQNAVELHISNLKYIPCFIRHGASDQVVHPFYSRRFTRLLNQLYYKNNDDGDGYGMVEYEEYKDDYVRYKEIENKEHWWWDTERSNDGGVTNDKQMRDYFKYLLNFEKEKDIGKKDFTLTVFNPATVGSKNGIRILQTWFSFQKSSVNVRIASSGGGKCDIITNNVRRLSIDTNRLGFGTVTIDGALVDLGAENQDSAMLCFVLSENGKQQWEECKDEKNYHLVERSPESYGPLLQVFESKFRIVYGTDCDAATIETYKQWSVYLANLWYMTGDNGNVKIQADIDTDVTDLAPNENILLIGDDRSNKWSKELVTNNDLIDFKIGDKYLQIGNCVYKQAYGFMSIFPVVLDDDGLRLGAIISGSNLKSMYDIVLMAKPTIPPMTRQPFSNTIPDYIVTGKDTFEKGFGGVIASGFWSYDWKWDSSTSYMSHCSDTLNYNSNFHETKREL